MTGENGRRNALDELARAETCLIEARALHDAALPYGASSRAYYAVFHAARALLFSVGIEATTHKGLVSLIGQHFVRPGLLASGMGCRGVPLRGAAARRARGALTTTPTTYAVSCV